MSDANFNRVVKLSAAGDEMKFQYALTLGGFGGRADLAVWDYGKTRQASGKRGPVIKVLFTLTSLLQLKQLIEKVVADTESKPVKLGFYPFNGETKTNEFRGSLTIGRDAEKAIYMEASGPQGEQPIRFYTITDDGIRLNDAELPKQYLSELGAKTIVMSINQLLPLATIFTQSNAIVAAPNYEPATPGTDDVPF